MNICKDESLQKCSKCMEMKGVWSPITYYNLFFITFLCSAVKDDSTVVFVDYKGTRSTLCPSPGLPTSRGITGFSVVCYGPIHLIRILYPLFDEEKLKMIYAKGGVGGIRPLVAQPLKLLKLLKR